MNINRKKSIFAIALSLIIISGALFTGLTASAMGDYEYEKTFVNFNAWQNSQDDVEYPHYEGRCIPAWTKKTSNGDYALYSWSAFNKNAASDKTVGIQFIFRLKKIGDMDKTPVLYIGGPNDGLGGKYLGASVELDKSKIGQDITYTLLFDKDFASGGEQVKMTPALMKQYQYIVFKVSAKGDASGLGAVEYCIRTIVTVTKSEGKKPLDNVPGKKINLYNDTKPARLEQQYADVTSDCEYGVNDAGALTVRFPKETAAEQYQIQLDPRKFDRAAIEAAGNMLFFDITLNSAYHEVMHINKESGFLKTANFGSNYGGDENRLYVGTPQTLCCIDMTGFDYESSTPVQIVFQNYGGYSGEYILYDVELSLYMYTRGGAPSTTEPTATAAPTTVSEPPTEYTDYSSQPTHYGDVNNDNNINSKDVLLLRKFVAKQKVELNTLAADCEYDGAINAKDVLILRKYIAKQPVTLGK